MNYNGSEYFYITDLLGNVIEMVDTNGNTVVEYKYDAWGNIIYQTPNSNIGDINPFRYRSYYLDTETGYYYLQSRYYNPEIGRFINSDGLLGEEGNILSHNAYTYCANNPVMYIDPEGDSFLITLLTISVIAMITMSTYACIPETRPYIEPVFDNISWSVTSGSGFEYSIGETLGIGNSEDITGYTCDFNGCSEISQGNSMTFLIYSESIYRLNGELIKSSKWGIPFIGLVDNNGNKSIGLSLQLSASYENINLNASLEIDIMQIIKDYKKLFFGE